MRPSSLSACLLRDTRAATSLQYVILVAVIAVPAIAVYASVGEQMVERYVEAALSVMGLTGEEQ